MLRLSSQLFRRPAAALAARPARLAATASSPLAVSTGRPSSSLFVRALSSRALSEPGAQQQQQPPPQDGAAPDVIWALRNVTSEMPEAMLRAFGRNNMSAKERAQLDVQSVIRRWQRDPLDTGSSEVQVAVFTERLKRLSAHMALHRKDMNTKRRLQLLVLQRNRMLKYMRRRCRDRYNSVIGGLGIRPTKNFDRSLQGHPHGSTSSKKPGTPTDRYVPRKRKKRATPYGIERTAKGRTQLRKHATRQRRLQKERDEAAKLEARQDALQARRDRAALAAAASDDAAA